MSEQVESAHEYVSSGHYLERSGKSEYVSKAEFTKLDKKLKSYLI